MKTLQVLASSDPIEHLLEKDKLFGIELPDWLWQDWTQGGLGISKPIIYMFFACLLAFFIFRHIARNFQEVPEVSESQKKKRGIVWYVVFPLWPVLWYEWIRELFKPGKGKLQAFFEPVLLFVRDEIVRPNLKDEELSEKFLPFFWSIFFFILFCNLIGLTPLSVTPTGQISVTATLAAISLMTIIGSGMWQVGKLKYWKELVPHDIPIWIKPLVFVIEIVGLLAKPFALCIRLLANMTGGHVVMIVLLSFAVGMNLFAPFYGYPTGVPGGLFVGIPVAVLSIFGAVALMIFEVIVSLVQAYVFTLLTSIFTGMAVHPEH